MNLEGIRWGGGDWADVWQVSLLKGGSNEQTELSRACRRYVDTGAGS